MDPALLNCLIECAKQERDGNKREIINSAIRMATEGVFGDIGPLIAEETGHSRLLIAKTLADAYRYKMENLNVHIISEDMDDHRTDSL